MRITKILGIGLLAAAALGLVGCGAQTSRMSSSSSSGWGSYKCTAASSAKKGRTSLGWATSKRTARANALDKCSAHSGGASCHIVQCVNES